MASIFEIIKGVKEEREHGSIFDIIRNARAVSEPVENKKEWIDKAVKEAKEFSSNPTLFSINKLTEKAKPFLKSVFQGLAREGASVGLQTRQPGGIANIAGASPEEQFIPQGKLQQAIWGTEPIDLPKKEGEKQLKSFGASDNFSKKYGGAAFGVMLSLDLLPGGGGKTKIIEDLSKLDDVKLIAPLLKKLGGFTDDAIEKLAPLIAKTGKADDIVKLLDDAHADTAITKLTAALEQTKPLRAEQDKLYKIDRAKRIKEAQRAVEDVGGEQGFFRQLSALKGEMAKVDFPTLRGALKQNEIDELFNQVENARLTGFEKISAKNGLAKILGQDGGRLPAPSEVELLSEVFPKEFIETLLENRSFLKKAWQNSVEALNLPRALKATLDLSAPLRQGVFLIGRPKRFAGALKTMFKSMLSEDGFRAAMNEIKNRPSYLDMREAKLAISDPHAVNLMQREEVFMSNLAERIPGFGRLAAGSSRAYSGFLNKLRADVFDDIVKKSARLGLDSSEYIKKVSDYVNTATGRGNIKQFQEAQKILNATFFSPRLMYSRLKLLNPIYYAKMPPQLRKEALRDLFSFAGVATTVIGLAKMNGAEVEEDPRSTDFAKIKIGNKRIDILGGFQQYIRAASQLLTNSIKQSDTGRVIKLGEGYNPTTRLDVFKRFFENKTSPAVSFAIDLLRGSDGIGQEIRVPEELIGMTIPLILEDMYDLYREGGIEDVAKFGALPVFGTGIQVYGEQEVREGTDMFGESKIQIRPVQDLGQKITNRIFGEREISETSSYNIRKFVDQLEKLPEIEMQSIWYDIQKKDPDIAAKIKQEFEDRKAGITAQDKAFKAMGVKDGERAKNLFEEMNKLKTPEEKTEFWNEMVRKKVITKDVARQLKMLIENARTR